MNTLLRCFCVLPLMAALSGCNLDADFFGTLSGAAAWSMCAMQSGSAVIPDEIPAELKAVQDDPTRFGPEDHPLANVPLGTVLDNLDALDGCWARYSRETYDIANADRTEEVKETIEVFKFNFAAKKLRYFRFELSRWENSPPVSFAAMGLQKSAFMTVDYDFTVRSDNMLRLEITHSEGAGIDGDGNLVYDCRASNGFFNLGIGDKLTGIVTLQGDGLKYHDTVSRPDEVDLSNFEDSGDLFVRIDCAV